MFRNLMFVAAAALGLAAPAGAATLEEGYYGIVAPGSSVPFPVFFAIEVAEDVLRIEIAPGTPHPFDCSIRTCDEATAVEAPILTADGTLALGAPVLQGRKGISPDPASMEARFLSERMAAINSATIAVRNDTIVLRTDTAETHLVAASRDEVALAVTFQLMLSWMFGHDVTDFCAMEVALEALSGAAPGSHDPGIPAASRLFRAIYEPGHAYDVRDRTLMFEGRDATPTTADRNEIIAAQILGEIVFQGAERADDVSPYALHDPIDGSALVGDTGEIAPVFSAVWDLHADDIAPARAFIGRLADRLGTSKPNPEQVCAALRP